MTNEELFSAVAIAAWKRVVVSVEKQVSSFSDDEVLMEVAPGRNRVYYIVGRLAAIHDRLLPMLGIGDRLHPELDDLFIEHPDRTFADRLGRGFHKRSHEKPDSSAGVTDRPCDVPRRSDTALEEVLIAMEHAID